MSDPKCSSCRMPPKPSACDVCRTINLARAAEKYAASRPSMQMYDKCRPPPLPCIPVSEVPVYPTCIRVCDKEEFLAQKCGTMKTGYPPGPGHGKLMYLVKAGLVAGVLAFTIQQGIWGSQHDTTECYRRWQEYLRSINTRRPPEFDNCGRVIMGPPKDNLFSPLYSIYKEVITSFFSGVIKFPMIVKCWYLNYHTALEKKFLEERAQMKEGCKK